ncbi:MAG TPA: DUF4157 domain-containing protein [Kofleriaceae bacterium]|nr:DUF4157 domain-containing protein [Kofleriaceae bacterium]
MAGTHSSGHGPAIDHVGGSGGREHEAPDAGRAAIAQMGPGQPLDAAAARAAAEILGQAPRDVTVHIGPEAERFVAQHQARAVTIGSHIAFGAGQYRPGTADGERLIAHELAHVIQMR